MAASYKGYKGAYLPAYYNGYRRGPYLPIIMAIDGPPYLPF
jgi:hypothetical protein